MVFIINRLPQTNGGKTESQNPLYFTKDPNFVGNFTYKAIQISKPNYWKKLPSQAIYHGKIGDLYQIFRENDFYYLIHRNGFYKIPKPELEVIDSDDTFASIGDTIFMKPFLTTNCYRVILGENPHFERLGEISFSNKAYKTRMTSILDKYLVFYGGSYDSSYNYKNELYQYYSWEENRLQLKGEKKNNLPLKDNSWDTYRISPSSYLSFSYQKIEIHSFWDNDDGVLFFSTNVVLEPSRFYWYKYNRTYGRYQNYFSYFAYFYSDDNQYLHYSKDGMYYYYYEQHNREKPLYYLYLAMFSISVSDHQVLIYTKDNITNDNNKLIILVDFQLNLNTNKDDYRLSMTSTVLQAVRNRAFAFQIPGSPILYYDPDVSNDDALVTLYMAVAETQPMIAPPHSRLNQSTVGSHQISYPKSGEAFQLQLSTDPITDQVFIQINDKEGISL